MIRDRLQQEAADSWVDKGILMCAPRFGKIKASFNICESQGFRDIMVIAPRKDIWTGWVNDVMKFGLRGQLTFSTTKGMKNINPDLHDCFIFDEMHEYSDNELNQIPRLIKNKPCWGLTGTATNKTREQIYDKTGMYACFEYSIGQAVEDKTLADYEINIHTVELDNKICYIPTSKGKITEKWRYDQLIWLMKNLKKKKKPTFFLDLKIINLLQNSIAKQAKTVDLLNQYVEERVLVFCGTSKIADDLGIPSYHSKTTEKGILAEFCSGFGNHLATIKMMQSGITVLPINRGILNYASGAPEPTTQQICRFLGFEYANPDKKAYIDLITTNTPFDKQRISTALIFMDPFKINYHDNILNN